MKRRHNWFELLLISEGCAFAIVLAFFVVMQLTMPRTDEAGAAPFDDPRIARIIVACSVAAGLLVWPLMSFVLRSRPLARCLPIVLGVTLAWIIVATPLLREFACVGSFPALYVALILCDRHVPRWPPPGYCQNCGYNLTGNVSGVCPECGVPR